MHHTTCRRVNYGFIILTCSDVVFVDVVSMGTRYTWATARSATRSLFVMGSKVVVLWLHLPRSLKDLQMNVNKYFVVCFSSFPLHRNCYFLSPGPICVPSFPLLTARFITNKSEHTHTHAHTHTHTLGKSGPTLGNFLRFATKKKVQTTAKKTG